MAVRKISKKSRKLEEPLSEKVAESSLGGNYSLIDKIKSPKILIPTAILLIALAAFYFKGLFVAALVNGQPITRFSIIRELESKQGKQALDALINQALIAQEAKKKNIVISQKEIDDAVKQIEDSIKKQGQNLDAALEAQGISRTEFLEQLKLRKLVEKLLAKDIQVADKEITEYIEKNKDSLPKEMKEEDLKKAIRQQLEQQKLSTKSQAWIENLAKNAKVNYFVNY